MTKIPYGTSRCSPLVARITPATLSIGLTTVRNVSAITVPVLDFTAENSHRYYSEELERRGKLVTTAQLSSITALACYKVLPFHYGSSSEAVATGSNILQFLPSFLNSTFELQFY